MSIIRREPRQVYRVFDESDFLEDQSVDEVEPASSPGVPGVEAARPRLRLAFPLALVAVVSAVACAVVLEARSPADRAKQRLGRRRGLVVRASAGEVESRKTMLSSTRVRRPLRRPRMQAGVRWHESRLRHLQGSGITAISDSHAVTQVSTPLSQQTASAEFGFER
jgi:hypothetical protein